MKQAIVIAGIVVLLVAALLAAGWVLEDLNRGLAEEKSFTKAAMLAYRRNPAAFKNRINRGIAEQWSDMDWILQAAEKDPSQGDWSKTADQLHNLDVKLQSAGPRSFCVVRKGGMTIVIALNGLGVACESHLIERFKPALSPPWELDWMSGNVNHSQFSALIRN